MADPLDQTRYLVAPKHRVQVLEYLSESSADREELGEQACIPWSTLSRVLTGVEEQH
jgi:DNA-binding IclR family transcriptional regulator